MTNGFFTILHPTFDALSAYADMPELDAARSRTGRHVARCAHCSQVVDEIRRLGDEARAVEPGHAPVGLWSRIADAAAVATQERAAPRDTPPPEAAPWEAAPSLKPTRHWPIPTRKATRIGLGLGLGLAIAAAAAIVAVLAWPGDQSLQASGLSRLTYSPARPAPGGMLTVRYRPGAWLEGEPRLVLVGNYSAPAGRNATPWYAREQLGDSLATLLPTRDGSYEARFRLPTNFLAMQLAVTDSTGDDGDSDGWFPWGVIAGEPTGAPSLRALLAAHETFAEASWGEGAARHNSKVNVADSLMRYFPSHPAGWAFASGYGTQKGVFSFLRFFQSAERRYLSLYEKLSPAPALDAEKLHDMVAFAFRIEEPAQAELWAKRLAREHPEDPRALYDLGRVLHAVELRQPAGLADSIRPWLPLLDSLYRRSPETEIRNSDVLTLAQRYGDSTTKALWLSRSAKYEGLNVVFDSRSDTEIRALSSSILQRVGAEAWKSCARSAGKFRLFSSSLRSIDWCTMEKSQAARTLAHVALLDSDPRRAIALTDSSEVFRVRALNCVSGGWASSHRISARAWLALGDTGAAAHEFVAGAPFPNQGSYDDSVRVALGRHFDPNWWHAQLDSSHTVYEACARRAKAQSDSVAKKWRERGRL